MGRRGGERLPPEAEPVPASAARLGSGRPLDAGTRQRMEGAFGQDFSAVRVHTGPEAASLAGGLRARAVTQGRDIAFGPGQYQPGTPVGDAVLAHELAHTIQQEGAAGPADEGAVPLAAAGSPLEKEADQAAVGAVAGLWGEGRKGTERLARRTRPAGRSGLALQRCSDHDVKHPPHTFSSCGFSADVSGALRARDHPGSPAPGLAEVESQTYRASGEVSIAGGTDAEAQDWEVGFLQTDYDSRIRGEYVDAAKAHHASYKIDLPGSRRDGDAGKAPWYEVNDVRAFSKVGQSVKTELSDSPTSYFPWASPDGAGFLTSSSGWDRFCSWLVVRQKSSGDLVYLHWATWEVDWGASFDPVAKTGKGTGAGSRVTGKGKDQGSITPQLGDPVANDDIQAGWIP